MGRGAFQQDKRRERIFLIEDAIKRAEEGLNRKEFVSHLCISWGNTTRKINEYITNMLDAGMIKEVDGILWTAQKN